jgi:hypothetical protein
LADNDKENDQTEKTIERKTSPILVAKPGGKETGYTDVRYFSKGSNGKKKKEMEER